MFNKLAEKLDRNKSNSAPFIILLLILVVIHCIIKLNYGDDLFFGKVLNENQLFPWIIDRYNTWSSRVIVESVLIIVMNFGEVFWKVLNITSLILLAVSISKLLVDKNIRRYNWVIMALILVYPLEDMSTAGWAATTINYIWPLSLGLYSLIIVKKILKNENIKWYEYVLSTLALIYAINVEQMCAILLVIYVPVTLYLILKKRTNIYMVIQSMICILSLIFILTCPGNAARDISETATWFPEFAYLSFMQKLLMGYSSSLAKFIFEPNAVFIIAGTLLFILVCLKEKNKYIRIISSLPMVCSIVFGIFGFAIAKIVPGIYNPVNSMTQYGITKIIPLAILTISGLSFIFSIYICFKRSVKGLICIYILLLGFASRMAIGFSPTIWVSNDRTFLYMYFSIIICSVILYQEIYELEYKNMNYIDYFIGFLALASFAFSYAYAFVLKTFLSKENLIEFIKNIGILK